jgi:lactoylglutathione lyase
MQTSLRFVVRWTLPSVLGLALSISACEQASNPVPDKYMLAEEISADEVVDTLPASAKPVTQGTPSVGGATRDPGTIATTPPSVVGALGLGVSDLKRSTDFYTRVLGMKQTQTFALGYMDEVVVAWEGTRGSSLVLMHWTDSSKINYKDLPIKVVVYVADPKALADKIRAEGLEITREPAPVPTLGNAIVGLAKDPDGYVIEILQATGQG